MSVYVNNKGEYYLHCNNCGENFYDKMINDLVTCPYCGSDDWEEHEICEVCGRPYLYSDVLNRDSACNKCYNEYYYNDEMYNKFLSTPQGDYSASEILDWIARKNAFMLMALSYYDVVEDAYYTLLSEDDRRKLLAKVLKEIDSSDDYNYFLRNTVSQKRNESLRRKSAESKINLKHYN